MTKYQNRCAVAVGVGLLVLNVLSLPSVFAGPIEKAMNETAFALMREQSKNDTKNIMISGPSIHMPLGMAYLGAQGETESGMAKALNFLSGRSKVDLPSLYKTWTGNVTGSLEGSALELRIANWILVSNELIVRPSFE